MDIYIHPTYIKVVGYSEDEDATRRICNYFSAYETVKGNGYKYKTFQAAILDEENDTLTLGGGISLDTLNYYYPDAIIHDKTKIKSTYRVNSYILLKPPKDEIQEKAIKFLKTRYNQKYLALQTGQGKTYCAINYCHSCRKLPLIILDQENLVNQWKEKIKEYTSARDKEIYIISGRKTVERLYKMKESERAKIKFILAFYQTLQSLYDSGDLKDFFTDFKIGLKIFDEAHLQYKSIFYINTCSDIETIYLSATPERVSLSEQKLYERLFYNVRFHKTKITNKYFNICLINVDMGFTDIETASLYNNKGFDVIGYNKALMEKHSKEFFGSIKNSLNKVFVKNFNRKKKVAIILKLIDQTDIVKKKIDIFLDKDAEKNNYERVLTTGILTGKTPKKQRKTILDNSDIIITTDKTFSKGIDVAGLEVLINFVPISCAVSTANLNQFTGRLRRLNDKEVFYVDIIDNSVNTLMLMAKSRIKYYKTIAKKIYNMNGYGVEKKG